MEKRPKTSRGQKLKQDALSQSGKDEISVCAEGGLRASPQDANPSSLTMCLPSGPKILLLGTSFQEIIT